METGYILENQSKVEIEINEYNIRDEEKAPEFRAIKINLEN